MLWNLTCMALVTAALTANDSVKEASGVAALRNDLVVVVGDEDDYPLWIMNPSQPASTLRSIENYCDKKLDDLESLCVIDTNRILAVCSQSLNKHGEKKTKRNRLALLTINPDEGTITDCAVYDDLRSNLLNHLEQYASSIIDDFDEVKNGKPKQGGLDIEGAAYFNDVLYLGLRGPLSRNDRAIILTVTNVLDVLTVDAEPQIGNIHVLPVQDGEAVRGLDASDTGLYVLLGPLDSPDDPSYRLVEWTIGGPAETIHLTHWECITQPEGVASLGNGRFLIVQDREDASIDESIVVLSTKTSTEADQ